MMNEAEKIQKTQIERPDKAVLGVMPGILLLFGGIGFAVDETFLLAQKSNSQLQISMNFKIWEQL